MAGNIRLIGAVGIKVRPDTDDFKRELREQIRSLPDYDIEVNVDADTTKAQRAIKKERESQEAKDIVLNVDVDYDGVKRGIAKVDAMLKNLDSKEIEVTLDRPGLLKVRRELEDMAKSAKVEFSFVKDEAGYRSVLAKINHIRRQKLVKKIEFDHDGKGLRKAEADAKAALARIDSRKTITIHYGNSYDGIQKAIDDVDARLDALRQLKITTQLDRKSLEAARAKLQDKLNTANVQMKIAPDKQGYEDVLKKIKALQREKIEKNITFKTDDESLRAEAEKYQKLIDGIEAKAERAKKFAPITLEINEDLKGYEDALKKIQTLQRERATVPLDVKVDKRSLERQAAKFQKLIKELTPPETVEITYHENRDSLTAAIKAIDSEIAKLDAIKLPVELNEANLVAERAKLKALFESTPLTMKINEDKAGYESVLKKIRELQRERVTIPITVDTDDAALAAKAAEIQAKIDDFDKIKITTILELDRLSAEEALHEAKKLNDQIESMKADMKVELAGAEVVGAQLRFLGRDRVVNFFARVSTRSIAAAEGLLKSLGGVNTISSLGRGLESLFTKFDTLSLKIGSVATALGSLGNIGVYAFTSVFKVGEGVVQSLGLLAAAPAILGAATAGYTIFTAAFNNFFDAFNKDPKIAASSLAALPPLARKTVDSITGLYKGLANPIQERFWEGVGTTLADSIETLYPKLKESLLNSTDAVGKFVAGIGKAMNNLALDEDFDKMFAGFNGFFENLSGASEPFFNAWNKFGVQGSQLLPLFGTWITENAIRFESWATKLSANGGITDLINQGVHSLQEMWKIGGNVGDMFKAISRAAGLAGTGGLAQFQLNLRKTADQMLSEPWQSRAANIFRGAREGASELNKGFHDLTGTLGKSSGWLGTVLHQLGQIGGASLSRLSDIFASTAYQSGITAELSGMNNLVSDLGPAFFDLGQIIGHMGTVAGAVFNDMAPVLNKIMGMLESTVDTLAENLADVAPKALASIKGVFVGIEPIVNVLANVVNGVLGIIGRVPNGFVLAGVAALAFFALRGLASKFYDSLAGTRAFSNLNSQWLAQQKMAGNTVTSWRMVNGEMKRFTVPTGQFNAVSAGFNAMRSSVGTFAKDLRVLDRAAHVNALAQGFGGLRTAIERTGAVGGSLAKTGMGGLMGALGGPWGLAIAGAAVAIGIFAQQQQNTKAHVESLTASIDRQTGALNTQGVEKVAKAWTDLDEAGDGMANLWRGSKAGNETAKALGLNFANVTKAITSSGEEGEVLVENLRRIEKYKSALTQDGVRSGGVATDLTKLKREADEAARALTGAGLQVDGLNGKDVGHLRENIQGQIDAVKLAKEVTDGLAQATGTASGTSERLSAAMATIRDNSADAATQIGAVNAALDILKGGEISKREAEVRAMTARQTAIAEASNLKEALKGGEGLILQTTGLIDISSAAGLQLQQTMEKSANSIKVNALAAYKAAKLDKKSEQDAMQTAVDVVRAGNADLQLIAQNAGVAVEDITKEWDGFFAKDWELKATFSGNADQVLIAKTAAETAGLEWDEKTFTAFMEANPDLALLSTDDVINRANTFANSRYEAQLRAMNPDALEKILEATGQSENYAKGDYIAVMKAINAAGPEAAAAFEVLRKTRDGPWDALIKAYMDAVTAANAERDLATLSRNREMNILVKSRTIQAEPLANGGMFMNNVRTFANGGMYRPQIKAFAGGGIENHVAQIARPSATYRVWAEPETGGEAYIPLSSAKRGRSTQILEQVAKQFGYSLTKTQMFADGGVVTGGNSRATSGMNVHIGTFNQNANDTIEDVGRGIMRQARNAGVTGIMDGI